MHGRPPPRTRLALGAAALALASLALAAAPATPPARAQEPVAGDRPLPPGAIARLITPTAEPTANLLPTLAFSPDGRTAVVITGTAGARRAAIFETARWTRTLDLGPAGRFAAFSPDGKHLALPRGDGVALLDPATGEAQGAPIALPPGVAGGELDGARPVADGACFSPDARTLLRTHTSSVQVRQMTSRPPPMAVVSHGGVFRRDDDITHSPMFHQIEGFLIDRNVDFGHLKGVLSAFAERLYGPGTRTRFRPSYFPFVEPGAEVDVSCVFCGGSGCRMCKHTGWIEILGCGMIHPTVFEHCGVDGEQWTGFAFGIGVERVAMLRYGVPDIRLFFENDPRFLAQF